MFHLSTEEIHLGVQVMNKEEAIQQIAAALVASGYVKPGYEQGMQQREQQISTYLGHGIAIPHGTTETRDQVIKTGITVFQFPNGVDWGDGEIAYIAIGIAAASNEHLSLLQQLTQVLSDETLTAEMAKTSSAKRVQAILLGKSDVMPAVFSPQTISLGVDAHQLNVLQSVNIARLQEVNAIDNAFIAHTLAHPPIHLGQGLWLSDSPVGNRCSAIAITTPQTAFCDADHTPVAMLITVSICDQQLDPILDHLMLRLIHQNGSSLFTATDPQQVIDRLTASPSMTSRCVTKEFEILNPHGLHARPSHQLVKLIHHFNCRFTLENTDYPGKTVDGLELIDVIGLGVAKGQSLRITAEGDDAQEAIEAIERAIQNYLGEDLE